LKKVENLINLSVVACTVSFLQSGNFVIHARPHFQIQTGCPCEGYPQETPHGVITSIMVLLQTTEKQIGYGMCESLDLA
jgi:hypothetical protein